MKKYISLLVAIILLLSMLAGCGQEQTEDTGSKENPIKAPDSVTEVSGFVVTEKRYAYQGNDVVIVRVENQTDKDYSVMLTGEFYDAAGEMIKTESQFFEGFAAGYQNYFLFQPNIDFDSFQYILEFMDFQGTALAKHIQFSTTVPLELQQSFMNPATMEIFDDAQTALVAHWQLEYTYDKALDLSATFVLFDNAGEIYIIDDKLRSTRLEHAGSGRLTRSVLYSDTLWENKEDFVWPEKLTGDLQGIVAVRSVVLNNGM